MVYTISKSVILSTNSGKAWIEWLYTVIISLPLLMCGMQNGLENHVAPYLQLRQSFLYGIKPNTSTSDSTIPSLLPQPSVPVPPSSPPFPDPEVFPEEVVSWILSAGYLAAALSTPIYMWLADTYGRRPAAFLVSVPQVMSGIIILYILKTGNIKNVPILIISRIIRGISSGGAFSVCPLYIKDLRNESTGSIVSFALVMQFLGYLVMSARGEINLDLIFSMMIALPFLNTLIWIMVPEAPSFLVKRCRKQEATKNLAKLLGLDQDDMQVEKEINRLFNESEQAKARCELKITKIMKDYIWRGAFKVAFVLHTVRVFGGSLVLFDYVPEIFMRLHDEWHLEHHYIAVPIILLVAGGLCVSLVNRCGRKIILTLSYCIATIALGVLAVFMQTDLNVQSMHYLAVLALFAALFSYGLGIMVLPYVLSVEVLHFEIRAKMLGVVLCYAWLMTFIHNYTFKYIESYLGIYVILYIYAGVNIYGAVYSAFGVPETKNMSIQKVEKQLRKVPLLGY